MLVAGAAAVVGAGVVAASAHVRPPVDPAGALQVALARCLDVPRETVSVPVLDFRAVVISVDAANQGFPEATPPRLPASTHRHFDVGAPPERIDLGAAETTRWTGTADTAACHLGDTGAGALLLTDRLADELAAGSSRQIATRDLAVAFARATHDHDCRWTEVRRARLRSDVDRCEPVQNVEIEVGGTCNDKPFTRTFLLEGLPNHERALTSRVGTGDAATLQACRDEVAAHDAVAARDATLHDQTADVALERLAKASHEAHHGSAARASTWITGAWTQPLALLGATLAACVVGLFAHRTTKADAYPSLFTRRTTAFARRPALVAIGAWILACAALAAQGGIWCALVALAACLVAGVFVARASAHVRALLAPLVVFVSYRSTEADAAFRLFFRLLEQELQRAPGGPEITFVKDVQIPERRNWCRTLDERLRTSHLMLAFTSDAYWQSAWCRRESEYYVETTPDLGRGGDGLFLPLRWRPSATATEGATHVQRLRADVLFHGVFSVQGAEDTPEAGVLVQVVAEALKRVACEPRPSPSSAAHHPLEDLFIDLQRGA